MKKNYFKESLSLIMTVLMIMSCWVFVAPVETEAANVTINYPLSVYMEVGNLTSGGDIKVYYYPIKDDGTPDTSSSTEYTFVNSLATIKETKQTITQDIPGWPYKMTVNVVSNTWYNRSVAIKTITIGNKTVFNDSYSVSDGKSATWEAGKTLDSWSGTDWTTPTWTQSSTLSGAGIQVPSVGSVSTTLNTKAEWKDQYSIAWPTSYSYSSTNGIKFTESSNTITTVEVSAAAIDNFDGTSKTKNITITAKGPGETKTANITLTAPNKDLLFENLFSLSDWYFSDSSKKTDTNVKTDLTKGTVAITNPSSAAGSEYTTSSNTGALPANNYAVQLEGGKTYYFMYDVSGTAASTEVFMMYKNNKGEPIAANGSSNAFESKYFGGNAKNNLWEFTVPEKATQAEIRLDNNSASSTTTFSNIAIYEKERADAIGIKEWTTRPAGKSYDYSSAIGSKLDVPVRTGYTFNGWYIDTNLDGNMSAGEAITDAKGNVLDTSRKITANTTLCASWSKTEYDIGYDNYFSLAEWSKTDSIKPSNSANGTISFNVADGTITAESVANGEVYSNYGGSNHYFIPVEPNTEYVFEADMKLDAGTKGQMFVFFYDENRAGVSGAIYNGTAQSNAHIGIYPVENGTHSITFTTPAGCTQMGIRVGATNVGTKATYSNIGFYEKADYDAYVKAYSKVREAFKFGDTKDLSLRPVRTGYYFDGWFDASENEVTSVAGFTSSMIVYAKWTKLNKVTFLNADGDEIKSFYLDKDSKYIASKDFPAAQYKDTDAIGSYAFAGFTADGTNVVTENTEITSDIVLRPKFVVVEKHENTKIIVETSPTCTENAIISEVCTADGCGWYVVKEQKYEGDNKEYKALGHDYTQVVYGSGTKESHIIKCTRALISGDLCGHETTEGHTYLDDPTYTEGSTCKVAGIDVYMCTGCGYEDRRPGSIDPKEHQNTDYLEDEEPTCTKDGKYGDFYCIDCNTVLEEGAVIPATGHDFKFKVEDGNYLRTEKNCTTDLTYWFACYNCDASAEDSKDDPKYANETLYWVKEVATGHDFTAEVEDEKYFIADATCTTKKTYYKSCAVCGLSSKGTDGEATFEVGDVLGHDYTGTIKSDEKGNHYYLCKNGCNTYGFEGEENKTTPCTYGEWDTTGETKHVKTCSECGYKLEEDHSFSVWKTTDNYKEADGQHSKTCSVCSKVVTEDCDYERTSYAETCTTDGFKQHVCKVCKHTYSTPEKGKTGHDYTGTVKSYNNGQHSFLCKNGCKTYGFEGVEGGRTTCTYEYKNTATGEHKVTCKVCAYSFTEACSGGQATCSELAVCKKCNTEYGETAPHTFNVEGGVVVLDNGTHAYRCKDCKNPDVYGVDNTAGATEGCTFNGDVVALDGDVHAYRCKVCNSDKTYGVGSEMNETEACYGGEATCTELAVCVKCSETYGETAPHTFEGDVVKLDDGTHAYRCKECKNPDIFGVGKTENAKENCTFNGEVVALEGDVHAYRCKVCDSDKTYGVGSEMNETEACSGGKATCSAYAICKICNETYGDYDKDAHLWGEVPVKDEDNKGYHLYACQYNPDHKKSEECTVGNTEVVAPDCNNEGYTINYCSKCVYTWNTDPVAPLGHSWGKWVTNKNGTHTRECTRNCGYDDRFDTEACTKEEAKAVVTAPTCLDKGYTTYTCNDCGYVWIDDYTDALGHKFDIKRDLDKYLKTEKDCETDLTYWYVCSRCDINAKEVENDPKYADVTLYWVKVAATGHKFTAEVAENKYLVPGTAATCTSKVQYYKSCKGCGLSSKDIEGEEATFETGKLLGHDWVRPADEDLADYLVTEPDCITDATYKYICSREGCNAVSDHTWAKENSKTGHDFDHNDNNEIKDEGDTGYTAYVAPTCENKGTKEHYTCSVCNKKFADSEGKAIITDTSISASGHKWVGVEYKAPTCEEDGYAAHKVCSVCNAAEDHKVHTKLGHTFDAKYGYYCDTDNNYHAFACKNGCGTYGKDADKYEVIRDEETNEITEIKGGVACNFDGEYVKFVDDKGVPSHKKVCDCGSAQSEACVDAEPTIVAPTCSAEGYKLHVCDKCAQEWKTDIVNKADHDYTDATWEKADGDVHIMKCKNYKDCKNYKSEACYADESTSTTTGCGVQQICKVCKDTFGELVEHDWVEKVHTDYLKSAANCDSPAIYYVSCSKCNTKHETVTFTYGEKKAHEMSEYVFTLEGWLFIPKDLDASEFKAPTCGTEGKSISYCANCSYYKTRIEVSSNTNHNWKYDEKDTDKWEVAGGNCGTGVTKKNICKDCGKVITKTVDVAHAWKVEFVKVASCTENGYIELTCTTCNSSKMLSGSSKDDFTLEGKVYSDEYAVIAAGVHDWVTTAADGEATMEVDGKLVFVEKYPAYNADGRGYSKCNKCNVKDEVKIPAYGNAPENHKHPELGANGESTLKTVAKVDPTCTTSGHLAYQECMRCSYSQYMIDHDAYYLAPLGHSDGDNNGKCDSCDKTLNGDKTDNCSCICHKENGFMKFIYKILSFFWKLFGSKKTCDCGVTHY